MASKSETMDGIAAGLAAIDATMITSLGGKGGPGTGVFYLLDNLAVSTLGVPRTKFPPPAPAETTDSEPAPVPVPAENA